jgi:hypothetical protein
MVSCSGPSLTSATATCLATTGDETYVWDVDAEGGPPQVRTWIAGRIVPRAHQERALVIWRDGDLLLLWRGTHRAVRLSGDDRQPRAYDAAYAAGHVVTLARAGDRDHVVRYPLAPPR